MDKDSTKNKDETPYSKEGRLKYASRMKKRPLKERAMELKTYLNQSITISCKNGVQDDEFNNTKKLPINK